MSRDYSTIQQHQPLRVPQGWDRQEKALIVQLDEIFDDIYRRFGRLRMEDMGKAFRKEFDDMNGNITEVELTAEGLTTRMQNTEGNVTQLQLTASGLTSTVGNWTSQSTITQAINSIESRITSLGYGTVYMQSSEPDHENLVAGDIWIQTQSSGTWSEVFNAYGSWEAIYNDVTSWQTLGEVPIMWVWDGVRFQRMYDALLPETMETEIQQNAAAIQLLANRTTAVEGGLAEANSAITVNADAITLLAQRTTNVENNKYTIQSGITITAAGIDISGSQYVQIASGGYFQVKTGNFGIDTNNSTHVIWSGASSASSAPFWVKKDGTIHAVSGDIGGFTLAANSLSSGTGATYVKIDSNDSNTYTMWAGAELAATAPFRLERNGTLYVTKLVITGENQSDTEVNLKTIGLWKLYYQTVRSYTEDSITLSNGAVINFNKAAEGWEAAYDGSESTRNNGTISVKIPSILYGTFSQYEYEVTVSLAWADVGHVRGTAYINGIAVATETIRANMP